MSNLHAHLWDFFPSFFSCSLIRRPLTSAYSLQNWPGWWICHSACPHFRAQHSLVNMVPLLVWGCIAGVLYNFDVICFRHEPCLSFHSHGELNVAKSVILVLILYKLIWNYPFHWLSSLFIQLKLWKAECLIIYISPVYFSFIRSEHFM